MPDESWTADRLRTLRHTPLAVALLLVVGPLLLSRAATLPGRTLEWALVPASIVFLICWGLLCSSGNELAPPAPPPQLMQGAKPLLIVLLLILPAIVAYAYAIVLGRYITLTSWVEDDVVGGRIGALLFFVLVVPVVEEWYFRGRMLTAFTRLSEHWWLSSIATAAWFASMHNDASIPGALTLSLCAASLCRLTGSLKPAMLAHSLTYFGLHLGAAAGRP